MAKGLTAGYLPLGGIIVSDKIIDSFNDKALPLGLTYSGHAVSCAAALAVLQVYEDEDLIIGAAKMGEYLDTRVAELTQKHPSIGDFRNTGLLGCIELVKNRKTKEPMAVWNAASDQMEVMNQVAAKIKELGMFTFVRWNFIFIAPPLNITKAEMDEGLDIISQAISIADAYCS
jgi:taurine--2-oxoglutarate transaminase